AVGVLDVGVGVTFDTQHAGLPKSALRITGHRVLDFDHISAPFDQHSTRRRNEAVHGDFQNADALQWSHEWSTCDTGAASAMVDAVSCGGIGGSLMCGDGHENFILFPCESYIRVSRIQESLRNEIDQLTCDTIAGKFSCW